jgi:hypothetical protein
MLNKFKVKIELAVIWILCLLLERSEQFLDAIRGECRLTKDAHDFNDWPANLKVMLNDSNEAIGDDGNMYLYPHSICHDSITVVVMWTIAGAKVQRNYNCYNVYFNECLLFFLWQRRNSLHIFPCRIVWLFR